MAQLAALTEYCASRLTAPQGGSSVDSMKRHTLAAAVLAVIVSSFPPRAIAAETAALTARELADKLGAAVQDGDSVARVRFNIQSQDAGEPGVLQLQIKSRRSAGKSEVAYRVLWPTERKGEGFVLRQKGTGAVSGDVFSPAGKPSHLGGQAIAESALGSDLAYVDTIENFFLWGQQALAGKETIGNADCVILESKPSGGDASSYGKVRSWIDTSKMLALRVEKFDKSGRLVRRIDTTQVAKDDIGRNVPAAMTVHKTGGGTTEIDGSNLRHDASVTDADFASEGAR